MGCRCTPKAKGLPPVQDNERQPQKRQDRRHEKGEYKKMNGAREQRPGRQE
ncbi:hypothetical protein DENIT_12630 [Pseudomonas veronii]|nr:hypothetical protein DENIT_12630 [Pseudomonas veronii]